MIIIFFSLHAVVYIVQWNHWYSVIHISSLQEYTHCNLKSKLVFFIWQDWCCDWYCICVGVFTGAARSQRSMVSLLHNHGGKIVRRDLLRRMLTSSDTMLIYRRRRRPNWGHSTNQALFTTERRQAIAVARRASLPLLQNDVFR